MKSRIVIIFVMLLGLWGVLIFRAANLQVLPNQRLAKLHKRTFKKVVTLKSRRGAIVDRNGKGLAITVPSKSLFIDPKMVKNSKKIAKLLSREIGVSRSSIIKKIKKGNRFVWVRRHLNNDQAVRISKWKLPGVGLIEEPLRVYPNGNLFSQSLGFVGSEGHGLEGIEFNFDKILQGEKRQVRMLRDARGRPLLVNGKFFMNFPEGSSIQLTIDSELQYVLERELAAAVDRHQAESAVGVVLDAQTSEILALGHAPTFNVNKAGDYSAEIRRIRAITDPFEPGSTMKTFVVAKAIKDKVVKPNSKFFCENGRMKIGRRTLKDADEKHRFGWLTVSDILAHSSNIGMTKIAFKMGAEKVREGLKDFGFGSLTNLKLPGERSGVIHKLPWRKHLLSSVSFGHGMTATPLQIATGYAAIANGGLLKKPILIKKIYNLDTGEKEVFESKVHHRVLSQELASTLRLMLISAAGANARIPGFQVAGKTGTAQKVNPNGRGYLKNSYIASFVGLVPASDPRFVIYIGVDDPKKQYYGTEVAAPVFAKVAQYAVRKIGLAPVMMAFKDVIKTKNNTSKKYPLGIKTITDSLREGITPNFEGLSLRDVLRASHGADVKLEFRGRGHVFLTTPSPGDYLFDSKKITLFMRNQSRRIR